MGKIDSHFKGKSVVDHLKEARAKGKLATGEGHGLEPKGHIIGGADAAKEASLVALLVGLLAHLLGMNNISLYLLLGHLLFGLIIWKAGRIAILSWSRLERVNKLIDDERNEIINNREEERRELTEMYAAKGFTSPLLEKVIDVLMADDNKLLGVMLEEELGVSLETYEHPLKEAMGAAIGVFLAAFTIGVCLSLSPLYGLIVGAFVNVFIASYVMSKVDQIKSLHNVVWNLSLLFLVVASLYFFAKFMIHEVV